MAQHVAHFLGLLFKPFSEKQYEHLFPPQALQIAAHHCTAVMWRDRRGARRLLLAAAPRSRDDPMPRAAYTTDTASILILSTTPFQVLQRYL